MRIHQDDTGAVSMPRCNIQLCAICMKISELCVGSNTIFQIPSR
jgi:hypothetical protein